VHRLGWASKFIFQILGATAAILGGLQIGHLNLFGLSLHLGLFGYLVTVFWFLLFINTMNLIDGLDGLDGLAAGISFFTCAIMVVLSMVMKNCLVASFFAALGGSALGFLRYNFNPARVFLGDGGSYFWATPLQHSLLWDQSKATWGSSC
jgi:UDP-GlcNAc:undecaprenyl-phosphate/decaprenyl-phosphate GlcNAc-1-phosphate transferase